LLAERAWGTMREDYSAEGDAGNYSGRCKKTPSVRKRGCEIPDPRVVRGEAEQGAARRSPSRGKATTALYSEIPTCDCLSRLRHVAVHQFRLAFHLNAAEGWYRLENDQKTTRRVRKMLSLDVALGKDDFECVVVEAEPDRCRQCSAVLAVGGEDSWRGRVQQRLHTV
jgi:hypothetical protein